jgi:hypothetical protein
MHGSSYARQQYIDYACGCSLLYKQTQGDDTLTFRTVITVSFLTSLGLGLAQKIFGKIPKSY